MTGTVEDEQTQAGGNIGKQESREKGIQRKRNTEKRIAEK